MKDDNHFFASAASFLCGLFVSLRFANGDAEDQGMTAAPRSNGHVRQVVQAAGSPRITVFRSSAWLPCVEWQKPTAFPS